MAMKSQKTMSMCEDSVVSFVYNGGTRKGLSRTVVIIEVHDTYMSVYDIDAGDMRKYIYDKIVPNSIRVWPSITINMSHLPSNINYDDIIDGYHADGYEIVEYNWRIYAYKRLITDEVLPDTTNTHAISIKANKVMYIDDTFLYVSTKNGVLTINNTEVYSIEDFIAEIASLIRKF